jgi:hypothetical protein
VIFFGLDSTVYSLALLLASQYNETNVMHFSFNLLRIKGIYMFRALLAHPQETLHKRHLVYARNIPNSVCAEPPTDKQVMLETFSIN